jgi:hypothetical protein
VSRSRPARRGGRRGAHSETRDEEPRFTSLVRSPLLIPRVRNPGGVGGRRLEAGLAASGDAPRAWALREERSGRRASLTLFDSPIALVHAYNAALRAAARAGMASRPEATPLTLDALRSAGGPAGRG